MNRHRWTNISTARAHYAAGDTLAAGAPIEAFFEIAARCNLRCQMCAIGYDATYRGAEGRPPFFEPDLFARLRPIFPSLVRAYLFGLGEPTLNKHLPDYIAELTSLGVEVWFNTNATLIDEEKAEAIARAGAECVTVSIDGATAATYETIRRGAKFEACVRGIRALVDAGRRYGRPKVNLSFVAMASNIGELPAMMDLCAELGAYGVHIEPLYLQPDSADLVDNYQRENLGNAGAARAVRLFDEAIARAASLGLDLTSRFRGERAEFNYVARARRERRDWTCSEPWSSIWVTSGGDVRTCCINDTAFGNLWQNSIEEIWNGERFRGFRAQHARREPATGCGTCMANGRIRNSAYFRTVERVTYRPMFDPLPVARRELVTIDTPHAGTTVTDPLVVTGRIVAPALQPIDLELMIDATPAANFHDLGFFRGDAFAMAVPIEFATEGAHVIWVRRSGETTGWGHREVFLWRPDAETNALRVVDDALFVLPVNDAPLAPSLTLGAHKWRHVRWSTMFGERGCMNVGRADLRALPPGNYDAEVALFGRNLGAFVLQKL
jgi:MoaA/NifB/PqqE/SkfB family radical SAM enzyme